MPFKSIEYKGKRYESKAALCQEYGIGLCMLQNRLKSGWSLEDAIEIAPKTKVTNGAVVFYDGKRYPSVKSLAKELELPYSSLQHYYARRGDIDEAVKCCRESSVQVLKLWGNVYESLSEIAHTFGLSYYHLSTRIRDGGELESVVKNALSLEPVTYHGRKYESFVDLCSEYQIQPGNVYGRLGYGFSLEEALTRPIKPIGNRDAISYKGEDYESKVALCRAYGLSYGMVSEQMRTNPLDFLEAFDVFVQFKERIGMPREELLGYIPHCRMNGKLHKSILPILRYVGITSNVFYTYKSRRNYENVFEALKGMQAEKRMAYLIEGKPVFDVELRKKYTKREMEEMEGLKVQVSRYPTLQNFDFDTGCCDTEQVYYEVLNSKLQEKEETMEIHME